MSAGTEPISEDVRFATGRVLEKGDHRSRPFAIVDKREARIYVFDADGRLVGMSPVLLGLAAGDDSAPTVRHRAPSALPARERITPAGRFASEPGHNDKGEDIVWIDYVAALAIHRLRPGREHERRANRMASPIVAEHRISLGCVVVPVAFYEEAAIRPGSGRRGGVVYVLPETRSVQAIFGRDDPAVVVGAHEVEAPAR